MSEDFVPTIYQVYSCLHDAQIHVEEFQTTDLVSGIAIFLDKPHATRLVISSSSPVLTFLITSAVTSSMTEIRNGGISTFTFDPPSLYLPALNTCFLISESVEPLNISKNFFVALSVIYLVETSGAQVVSGPFESPEISKLGSTFLRRSAISRF